MPLDMDAVARAEAVVASFADDYLGWLIGDLDEIEGLISEAAESSGAIEKLRRKTHDIRGQGGSFGFPLITQTADGLHRIVGGRADTLSAAEVSVAREILDVMRAIVARRVSGDGDAVSREAVRAILARIETISSEV